MMTCTTLSNSGPELHASAHLVVPSRTSAAGAMLDAFRVARVAANPARVPEAGRPGGWRGLVYYRLHGSPELYRSAYPEAFLDSLAVSLRSLAREATVWCIFDNTAAGAATANALTLLDRVSGG